MTRIGRLGAMLRWDVRLQLRYGFYAVYGVIVAAYVLGLLQVGTDLRPALLALAVFGDPSFLGFYFIAALVLFEKREGAIDTLAASPLRGSEYLASKALSLTLLAVGASLVVTLLAHGPGFDLPLFLLGVVLTSVLFVLVGFAAVARFDTLNAYFTTSLVYMLPTGLPFLEFAGIAEHPLLYLIPTRASLVLIGGAFGAFGPVPAPEIAYAVGYLLLSIGVAAVVARRAFERHVVAGFEAGGGSAAVPESGGGLGGGRFGPVATLALADLRNWARDPLLVFIAFVPVVYAVVLRFLVPFATDWLAPGLDLLPYYPVLVGVVMLMSPFVFGFVTGFFVLEERDADVVAALWTTPLTGRGYLVYRGVTACLVSFVAMLVVVPLAGIVAVPLPLLLAVAAVGSLWGAASAFMLASLASNSVEGVAISKLFGLLVMLPALAIALVPEPLQLLAGVIPVYWPLKALVVGLAGGPPVAVGGYLAAGALAHALALGWLVRRFEP